jgi:pimeloyl-ACP methyl ester carboxylesterase
MARAMTLIAPLREGRLERPGRPAIAFRHTHAIDDAPTIIFLPGYASDMSGSKATAIFDWAAARGVGAVLFDYAGCGASGGVFADQTLDDWFADTLAIIDATVDTPLLLIGSSMGGWLMLRAAIARSDRVRGMIGIAAAPDFTEWDFGPEKRAILARDGQLLEPNPYGPEPTLFTQALWESGQASLQLSDEIAFDGPTALLHGQADADVPWSIALRIAEQLRSAQVEVTLIKDGDHRLSREQDIALLLTTVDRMIKRTTAE